MMQFNAGRFLCRPAVIRLMAALMLAMSIAGPASARDVAGGRDHPLVGRYEGSTLQV